MATLRQQPFDVGGDAHLPAASHLNPEELTHGIRNLTSDELVNFVRAYVQERTPAAFSEMPLLWEAVRVWLASRCGVHPREIGLSGSSQLGYSIVESKSWAPFDRKKSDLDLFFVSSAQYAKVEAEARRFVATNTDSPRYRDQAQTIGRLLQRGWVDVKHIPANHDLYPTVATLLNDASILIDRLKNHGFDLRPSSFRAYPSWLALSQWTKLSYKTLVGRATQ